jgi:hypothetical protein
MWFVLVFGAHTLPLCAKVLLTLRRRQRANLRGHLSTGTVYLSTGCTTSSRHLEPVYAFNPSQVPVQITRMQVVYSKALPMANS